MINNYKTISFEISHMKQFKKERFAKGQMSPKLGGDGKSRKQAGKIVDIQPQSAKTDERFKKVVREVVCH